MRGNFFYKRIGKRLIRCRAKKELSQEQLALLSTIDRTYVARIEEGKANPTLKVMYKLTKVLRVRLCELLRGV